MDVQVALAIHREKQLKLLRDLFLHLVFSVVFLTVILLQRDVFACNSIKTGIDKAIIDDDNIPFTEISQWEDLSGYLLNVLMPAITKNETYTNQNVDPFQQYTLEHSNSIIGSIRFRQLRVRNDSCDVSPRYRKLESECFSDDPNYGADKLPFGPPSNRSKYVYTEDSKSLSFYGYQGYWLGSGGYVVDMPLDEVGTLIPELVEDQWWDKGTRAIIITINTVNVNLGSRVSVIYLILEFTSGGTIVPSWFLRTFRLTVYLTSLDYFRASFEIVFALFLLYFIADLITEIVGEYRMGTMKSYFSDVWVYMEVVNISMFIVTTALYVRYLDNYEKNNLILDRSDYVHELEPIAQEATLYFQISAFNIFLSVFKVFKYLKLHKRLYVLWRTMDEAGIELLSFTVMFFIILSGFLFFAWLSFGADVDGFNGFVPSLGSCWNFLMGSPPDFDVLYRSNRILGPVFYTVFTVFAFFILVNIFIAIINDSYSKVHGQAMKDDPMDMNIIQALKGASVNIWKALKKTTRGFTDFKLIQKIQQKTPSFFQTENVTDAYLKHVLYKCELKITSKNMKKLRKLHDLHKKLKQGNVRESFETAENSDDDEVEIVTDPTDDQETELQILKSVVKTVEEDKQEKDNQVSLETLQEQMTAMQNQMKDLASQLLLISQALHVAQQPNRNAEVVNPVEEHKEQPKTTQDHNKIVETHTDEEHATSDDDKKNQ